jgi:hypothetical protein
MGKSYHRADETANDRRAAPWTAPPTPSLAGVTIHSFACEPIPSHLMQMIRDGGLLPHLEKRLRRKA